MIDIVRGLEGVLCDSSGRVCIVGSDGDRRILSDILTALHSGKKVVVDGERLDAYLKSTQSCLLCPTYEGCPHKIGPIIMAMPCRERRIAYLCREEENDG